MPDSVVVHLTPTKAYRILCPQCAHSTNGTLQALAPNFSNPFVFHCRCGNSFKILLNVRAAHRKACKLPAEYSLSLNGREVNGVCTVLELSKTGMRLEANYLGAVQLGQAIRFIIMLDDSSSTRIPVSGSIQWVRLLKPRVVMGVRFTHLDPHPQQMLGFYLL
jgi:PilZ domain-containing protein